uniref:Plexin-B1 n=1 Tax=Hucho hucho TaxID=62062 RepID=A0A4W5MZW3_9TELE
NKKHATAILSLLLAASWPSYGLAWASDPSSTPSSPYPTFTRTDALFEHLALHPDPAVGRIYVGARDHLFQLDRNLTAELQDNTGPVTDSRECLPPVTESNCPQARRTSNHNKLLLVDPYAMELITCGSVNQGICQKRSLDSVGTVLFSAERPVDTQYVAANHPNVSTVGLVVRSRPDRQPVLFVGRGYTSSHPPISTRNLAQEPVFSYEETAKLAVAGRLSEYDHHFVASFAHRQHVYFLFYRRDIKSQSREYRTYVSRVCLDDQAYYSYVEVPLACRSAAGKSYNLLQAVHLGLPPKQSGGDAGQVEVLLGVFSTRQASSTRPSEDSALCMFNLDDLDQRINSTRDLCYTQFGRDEEGGEAAYIEYEVKSNCANLPSVSRSGNTLDAYPCGSDHTPSPMASRVPVETEPILDSPSARLTAVAVSVRVGHTIAFLGDSKGNLRKLQKRPVAECHEHLDCQACLSAHDPYCGWCVLEGSCRGCVLSRWGCNWCVHQHTCTHKPTCDKGVIVYNEHVSHTHSDNGQLPRGQTACYAHSAKRNRQPGYFVHCRFSELTIVCLSLSIPVTLYNCSVGRSDCSRCHTADQKYGCVWCGGGQSTCLYGDSCSEPIEQTCPAPVIHAIEPLSGLVEGGTVVTISGSNLGQKAEDILHFVSVAGVSCSVIPHLYEVSSRIVCKTEASGGEKMGQVSVEVSGGEFGLSSQRFSYQDPFVMEVSPQRGPMAGGSSLTITGRNLLTGRPSDITVTVGGVPCVIGGRLVFVSGHNLDVVQEPRMLVTVSPYESIGQRKRRRRRSGGGEREEEAKVLLLRRRRIIPDLSTFPLEAQIGVGVGASIVALIVLIIVLIYRYVCVGWGGGGGGASICMCLHPVFCTLSYECNSNVCLYVCSLSLSLSLFVCLSVRRKSKQALRDYKKVQIQLENLETSVRDRCKKEFTDLMTEMMDMSSDLVGSGIPFLDYRRYAERIFFPGHRESPLRRDLDVQECRRATVEQGLVQLSNLLNSKLFLTKFIHTLESQRTFSPRDRAYVASLLTVALHGKLEYFTDILKTLLNDLVEQYVAKNPKLMLRRTETVVEKLLTNWMSICLYAFLRDSAGESLYMLFRAIKHQVDKGPVDAVTGKAKYTLNDNRLLREDVEYKTLTLNVLMQGGGVNETQPLPSKVLDIDTITQVKEKLLDQVYKGTSFSHRPHTDSLDLEWRSGVAGHLILSDEDLTSVVQGNWKRLNTLQHYKVPDGATVALVPRHSKHIHHDNHDYGGVRLWHLVKASEEPELPKHRRGSVRERERAKAIPEIYLTRLLSMKGTLQKFVDDLFTVILSTSRPVPLAVKYFFDLLDDQAQHHAITDPETIHIWKTNSLPLRFWINIVKNPQFIFDVQPSDHVDAVLTVISQTFMDSCTTAEHKLGRDSPINKLLYARDIPRYKQMVERYYADIRQTISASDQEMNSALAELSRNYSGELNYLVALHELYKYINKYYDQIIGALEEDSMAQKMQLGYRLQQVAAAVENKVTDL